MHTHLKAIKDKKMLNEHIYSKCAILKEGRGTSKNFPEIFHTKPVLSPSVDIILGIIAKRFPDIPKSQNTTRKNYQLL